MFAIRLLISGHYLVNETPRTRTTAFHVSDARHFETRAEARKYMEKSCLRWDDYAIEGI